MRAQWTRLELGIGERVWRESAQRFTQVVGPHFEHLCRSFAATAEPDLFGDVPAEVAAGAISDPARREQIQVDAVVLGQPDPAGPRRVLSLGEAKWGTVMDEGRVERLRRAKDLLSNRGFDTRDTKITCYGGAGFHRDLRSSPPPDVVLVPLDQLYPELPR